MNQIYVIGIGYLFCGTMTFLFYTNWSDFTSKLEEKEVLDVHVLRKFHDYMKKFNKKYSASEIVERFRNFEKSLSEISYLNNLHGSQVFGMSKFSDWSDAEFSSRMLAPVSTCRSFSSNSCPTPDLMTNVTGDYNLEEDIPSRFDWRERGVVGPVLSQKLCNACWAFAVVGVMETMAAITGRRFGALSIQELIDCCPLNEHCNFGEIYKTLDFLCSRDYGLVDNEDYPLTLADEGCKYPISFQPKGVKIAQYINRCRQSDKELEDETTILRVVAHHGPVVATVNAIPWKNYHGDVIRFACPGIPAYLNHAVQIVGYDLNADPPHYIVRNSWGSDFGDDGYVKLAIGSNMCGISEYIAYFKVKIS